MIKKCIKCNSEKDIDLFVKNRNVCKNCMSIYKQNYHQENKEIIKEKSSKYYEERREMIKEKVKKRYDDDKEKKLKYQKQYSEENKESIRNYKKKHYEKNKESIREYKRDYQNKRRKEDPIFMLKYSLNRSIRNSLKVKGLSKSKKIKDILGCDIHFFKKYLENKFTEEMNWNNYGKVWDLDHIIPLSTAKEEQEVYELNHYTNFQPLDSYVNRYIKRDKIDFYEEIN
jgi:hypothetical protein